MTVGTLAERVTVSGAASAGDVRRAGRVQTMSRAIFDALPTGRNIPAIGGLVPGIKLSNPDLGGSSGMENIRMFMAGAPRP